MHFIFFLPSPMTVHRFAIMLSVFIFVAPFQFVFLYLQLYVFSSLVNWFLVLLPTIVGIVLITLYGAMQFWTAKRAVVKMFDLAYFLVAFLLLLAFFLLLAAHLNGDSAPDTWFSVFVPLIVFAAALVMFQALEEGTCRNVPVALILHACCRCRRPSDAVLEKYRNKIPLGPNACQLLRGVFWLVLLLVVILLPLALEEDIAWTAVFVLAYIGTAILAIDLLVLWRTVQADSSVNALVKPLLLAVIVLTLIALHVHVTVGEANFPGSFILLGLSVVSALASFTILYIRWRRRIRPQYAHLTTD